MIPTKRWYTTKEGSTLNPKQKCLGVLNNDGVFRKWINWSRQGVKIRLADNLTVYDAYVFLIEKAIINDPIMFYHCKAIEIHDNEKSAIYIISYQDLKEHAHIHRNIPDNCYAIKVSDFCKYPMIQEEIE